MTVLYLSGPMSGMPDLNFPAFHAAAADLRARGFTVINPAELDAADAAPMEWEQYLRRDIRHLMDADRIAMLAGWERSRGAKLELHIATALRMPVMFLTECGLKAA